MLSVDDVFKPFDNISDSLEKSLGIIIEDDAWFIENQDKPYIDELARQISARYKIKRNKPKGHQRARHDALLLAYIEKLITSDKKPCWLVTADLTLSENPLPNLDKIPIISLDGLLTWLAPLTVGNNDSFASMFAEMIKAKLLPNEKLFEIEDFNIFADLQMQCKELPSEDVESCIRHIKANASHLDPSKPLDREKLFYSVRIFFSDPGRQYRSDIDKLILQNAELSKLFQQQEETITVKNEKQIAEFNKIIGKKEESIKSVSDENATLRNDLSDLKTRLGAIIRLFVSGHL